MQPRAQREMLLYSWTSAPAPANAAPIIDTGKVVGSVRQAFPRYYAAGIPEGAALLDALALARAAFLVGVGAPRDRDGGDAQAFLERATDAMERRFTQLRERVRKSTSFQIQTAQEQARMEASLFSVKGRKPLRLALRHEVLDQDTRHRSGKRHLEALGVKTLIRDRLGWPAVEHRPGSAVTPPNRVDVIGPASPFRVRTGYRPHNAAVRELDRQGNEEPEVCGSVAEAWHSRGLKAGRRPLRGRIVFN